MTERDASAGDARIAADSLGSVTVARDALYGAHTVRAIENFRVSGFTLRDLPDFVAALAEVKVACARANAGLGELAPAVADAIAAAGREIVAGRWTEQFPIDVVQGGGGTATNMNVNEVIARRATQLLRAARGDERSDATPDVHPNDHVNRAQSTNDVYPTALALAVHRRAEGALDAFGHLAEALERKAQEYPDLRRLGRTCLQDAVPLGVAETHRGQAHAIARTSARLALATDQLLDVPLGATAVGTGLGAPPGYRSRVVALLAQESGVSLRESSDCLDSLAHLDGYVGVMGALVQVMLVVRQLAADLRLLSSGPCGGLGEITLPAVQVGSSMMPGKVNPVIPELVMQIASEVRGAAATVEAATADGELELNIMEPVVARHVLCSLADAGSVSRLLADRCVAGLIWNVDRVERNLSGSREGAVERAVASGYDAAHAEAGVSARSGVGR